MFRRGRDSFRTDNWLRVTCCRGTEEGNAPRGRPGIFLPGSLPEYPVGIKAGPYGVKSRIFPSLNSRRTRSKPPGSIGYIPKKILRNIGIIRPPVQPRMKKYSFIGPRSKASGNIEPYGDISTKSATSGRSSEGDRHPKQKLDATVSDS